MITLPPGQALKKKNISTKTFIAKKKNVLLMFYLQCVNTLPPGQPLQKKKKKDEYHEIILSKLFSFFFFRLSVEPFPALRIKFIINTLPAH